MVLVGARHDRHQRARIHEYAFHRLLPKPSRCFRFVLKSDGPRTHPIKPACCARSRAELEAGSLRYFSSASRTKADSERRFIPACFFRRFTKDSEMRMVMRWEDMSDILSQMSDTWNYAEYTTRPLTIVATTLPV